MTMVDILLWGGTAVVVAAVCALLWITVPQRRTIRAIRALKSHPSPTSDQTPISSDLTPISSDQTPISSDPKSISSDMAPQVSVVVVAGDEEDEVETLLESIYAQEYTAFEVILVFDATAETAAMLAERYGTRYDRLHVTFIPPGSHIASRRKLAITLGVKAAQGEVILLTASDVRIPTNRWISEMSAPFAESNTDLVLGITGPDMAELGLLERLREKHHRFWQTYRRVGYALAGKPYRGDCRNMAFRRSTFNEMRGFASTAHLETGEEDVFVREISNGSNTAVVVSPDAHLTTPAKHNGMRG